MIGFLFPAGIFVTLVLLWFFFRSGGYKRQPLDAPPGRDWSFTGERFVDPKSGKCWKSGSLRETASAPMFGRDPVKDRRTAALRERIKR